MTTSLSSARFVPQGGMQLQCLIWLGEIAGLETDQLQHQDRRGMDCLRREKVNERTSR